MNNHINALCYEYFGSENALLPSSDTDSIADRSEASSEGVEARWYCMHRS